MCNLIDLLSAFYRWRVIEPDPPVDSKNGGIRRSSHESDVSKTLSP